MSQASLMCSALDHSDWWAVSAAAEQAVSVPVSDWCDVSSTVADAPLQAAVQDGVISFLQAAAASQDAIQQKISHAQQQKAGSQGKAGGTQQDGSENLSPNTTGSIDSMDCLEVE